MDDYVVRGGIVDPEVRAHVYSLVSALGGASASADGQYVLGDDALACLKDIKRWLKLHDEKLNRLDVTRCLAEANLVKGDLLEILGGWTEEALEKSRWRSKIALACLELLVPLTWPMERDILGEATRNQHRHLPYIQLAQVTYKREVLEHPSGDVLRKAVRIALPAMATPVSERTPRDEGILKLVLYLIRNIAMISAPGNLPVEWNEQEISRSATIKAFQQQDVFPVLLTVASNVMEDFKNQDVVVLEVLFHLLKGIDPNKLFMSNTDQSAAASKDLRGLMKKEDAMLRGYAKSAPTRHNRFGTMVWVKRDEEKVSTVSGQDVLMNDQQTLDKMDKSKKWNKPKRQKPKERTHMNFDMPENLADHAREPIRAFVEEFLDSGFNPLFAHLRKAIEREADRVLEAHIQQFWYLVSWFLQAESVRRRAKRKAQQDRKEQNASIQTDSFAIVASVLNQETFILLNRYMQSHMDLKNWMELEAGIRCFTQILLTTQEMANSPLEEDQEIAENIQNRIFYEETTHDRVLAILRNHKDEALSHLDASTEMAHVFLRLLERYSKENGDLQIRSRRRARKTRKEARKESGADDENPDQGSEAEDEEKAAIISRERNFDFKRFASKFVTQASVDTFVKFMSYYRDLSTEQLKRAHRFFYRVAFKQDMSVLLFRIDIVQLFSRMVQGSEQLSKSDPMFREWEEFVRQIFRRLVKKMQQRPELAVELLFSKISATTYYLEFGHEKQTIAVRPRAPAELEVRGGLSRDDQLGVAVAVLLSDDKSEHVEWAIKMMQKAADERQAWASETAADSATAHAQAAEGGEENSAVPSAAPDVNRLPPAIGIVADSESRRVALFKDSKLRLLLTLCGAERVSDRDDPDAPWYVPSSLTADQLLETIACVQRHKNNPQNLWGPSEDDQTPAADMLKRKAAPVAPKQKESGMFDDDDGLDDFIAGEEFLFPAGGPTNRKNALDELKQKRRSRRRSDASAPEEIDDETREARRRARALRELEKRRKIKSEEFIHDSDEESNADKDEAFFRKEREIAAKRSKAYERAVKERIEAEEQRLAGKGKRKRGVQEGGPAKKARSSDNEAGDTDDELERTIRRMKESESGNDDSFLGHVGSPAVIELDDLEEASDTDEEDEDTPISSQSDPAVEKLALQELDSNLSRPPAAGAKTILDEEEDVLPSHQRRRARAAVLDDSDDE